MARSLTVKHDEQPATTPLFTAFLLLAAGVLALSGLSEAKPPAIDDNVALESAR